MALTDLVRDLFFALWIFLPAALGNMMPIFAAKTSWRPLRNWTAPIDFGKSFRGKRIFGAHKTWRGLVTGMIASTLTLAIEQLVFKHSALLHSWIRHIDYASLPTLILGPLFGLGALGGDALKSFFKRQRGIAPGDSWIPFDQLDLPAGELLAVWPLLHPTLRQACFLLIIGGTAQCISSYVGYRLDLKEKPI